MRQDLPSQTALKALLAYDERTDRARDRGKALPKGVRANGSGFTARISYQGRLETIGTFTTPEEAASAYLSRARDLYGDFARAA